MLSPIDKNYIDYKGNKEKPEWLETYQCNDGFPLISQPSRYAHDEAKYDKQYQIDPTDVKVGNGLINLLREKNADFMGAALEVGCGTGRLSLGLVNNKAYPVVILTDPSTIFLRITSQKMREASVDISNVHFAVLKAEEIDRLPRSEFSLIVLRSVLHHVLDVTKFINSAAMSLRQGGILVFQEPCMEGYVLMGAMAQFIPIIIKQSGIKLNDNYTRQIQSFIDTMQFYARRDVDKSSAEDKHLFRVDEIMKICSYTGLSAEFLPNVVYEQYSEPSQKRNEQTSFYTFFRDYLKYCMSFDQTLIELIDKHFRNYCKFVDNLSVSSSGPYMHGVFVCRKQ